MNYSNYYIVFLRNGARISIKADSYQDCIFYQKISRWKHKVVANFDSKEVIGIVNKACMI